MYDGRQNSTSVPLHVDALEIALGSLDGENEDRSEVYGMCLGIVRPACQLAGVQLTGVFASVGRLMRNVELDIRNPVAQKRYGKRLRGYKHQYVEILVRKLDGYLFYGYNDELGKSLAETLRYVREVVATEEPGHPENRATLDLFKLIRTRLQTRAGNPQVRLFMEECDTFEAWIDMGGCAKVGFLRAANMATRLSNYSCRALVD
ncbi:hypothetical protein FS837_001736 [Tulasnella sp. UAMH 9824]|nr:hypothetical protein FS837_001736 [Tulasnella sp. UAMH 9824]